MISHLPNHGMRINIGVVSVICFYFISGYLMRKSYARFKTNSNKPVLDFYIDRIIKLFPQYGLVVILTFASLWCFGRSDFVPLLNQDITLEKVLLNLAVLPTNYVFYPFIIDALKPHPIIPPAWSLATEFHFYLVLPLIVSLKKRFWFLLLFITVCVQFSSFFFSHGPFNSNTFGYRYIFGVLTVFLYGYAFAEKPEAFYRRVHRVIWLVFTLFLIVIAPMLGVLENPFVLEVLIGGFIALPLGIFFTKANVQKHYVKIDNLLGDLAYPMFISHFLSFYLVEKLLSIRVSDSVTFNALSIVLCITMSFFLSLLQKKVDAFRIKKRGFSSLKTVIDDGCREASSTE
jgi:peptidoglycan/LPS O-acetylase OafA/YrhL